MSLANLDFGISGNKIQSLGFTKRILSDLIEEHIIVSFLIFNNYK